VSVDCLTSRDGGVVVQVVFITEYMSSGSLRQFLRKTKRGSRTLKVSKNSE